MIHFENRDCMEAMREFPDNYFDLAIVDPPYGDGSQTVNVERERERESRPQYIRFGGRFDKYKCSEGGVARQTEISPRYTISERIVENRTEHGAMRTGGQWAAKYAKKSLRGMLRRNRNILTSCFASHVIRLYGEEIISRCLRQGVS